MGLKDKLVDFLGHRSQMSARSSPAMASAA